jgi:large subunit ribosomal protein L13
MMETHPERVVQLAVRGMLPRNKLGREMLKRLKIYGGDTHPHQAQIAGPMPAGDRDS